MQSTARQEPGKSTIARALARKLGYIYVDTGALYRSIGLYCTEAGVPLEDKAAVTAALEQIRVELRYVDGVQRVLLNGRDVSEEIRRPEISLAASSVSAMRYGAGIPVRSPAQYGSGA